MPMRVGKADVDGEPVSRQCNYRTPEGYAETCVYDRNSGNLLGDNKATFPDKFCYLRAAQASCPSPVRPLFLLECASPRCTG